METEAEKIIEEQVKKLPPEVRDALASEELHKKIVAIGERHHLHIDQVGSLENEVVLVMMGLAGPAELPGELVKQLSLQPADAEAIASDISQDVFLPIRDAMKKFTETESSSVVMPSAANAPATPKPAPVSVPPPMPAVQKPVPAPPAPAPKPAEAHAELMLREATVSMPPKPAPSTPAPSATPSISPSAPVVKAEAPKPAPYKADPYREPPE